MQVQGEEVQVGGGGRPGIGIAARCRVEIPYVAVNGRLVVDEGRITDARPGRVLRGPGYKGAPSRRALRPALLQLRVSPGGGPRPVP